MRETRDIREAVEAELTSDPLVNATNITVQHVNGTVALTGGVPSYPQYLEAAAAARRAEGVTSVHNHLKVTLPSGDERDDARLTTAANNALAENVSVPDGIEATARNGDLTLTGAVSYVSHRAASAAAVIALTGVRAIENKIEVRYETEPADITLLVNSALARYAIVPEQTDVRAATAGNTVTLTGHVRTAAEHDAVVGAIWEANGVYAVIDELYVTG